MLKSEPVMSEALESFSQLVGASGPRFSKVKVDGVSLCTLQEQKQAIVFMSLSDGATADDVKERWKQLPEPINQLSAHEIILAVEGVDSAFEPQSLARGVLLTSVQDALARLVGLPAEWRDQQRAILQEILRPVCFDDGPAPVPLRTPDGEAAGDVLLRSAPGTPVYLRAEAGKGKSTTLAWLTQTRLDEPNAVPWVFVPLRELTTGAGVSWEQLVQRLGVTGGGASRLSAGVRAGLLAVALDGLDEVAGRYDPAVVKDVLSVLREVANGPQARVVLSGRTTESQFLEASWREIGLVLPSPEDEAFTKYVELVCSDVGDSWASIFRPLPEPLLGVEDPSALEDRSVRDDERVRIVEWVQLVFEELGKDSSLFFTQSLVGAARTLQLDGNQALVINGQVKSRPSTYDIARLAASLACVREVGKIEELARSEFTPRRQLDVLTWFAVLGAASGADRADLPLPNRTIKDVFGVDPTNQNEVFTSIIRQMQKHALLYASGEQVRAGDWRPVFLSPWTRNTLLVRAWENRTECPSLDVDKIESAIAKAEQAEIAYDTLFSEVLSEDQLLRLLSVTHEAAVEGSSAASANFWRLYSAVGAELQSRFGERAPFNELADLSAVVFEGVTLDERFAPKYALFSGAMFMNCELVSCSFEECDLSHAQFLGCSIRESVISKCSGPCSFEECEFIDTTVTDITGRGQGLATFVDSYFGDGVKLSQQNPPVPEPSSCDPVFSFEDCRAEAPGELLAGEWLGLQTERHCGISDARDAKLVPPEHLVLRAALKTFFPSRWGTSAEVQARRYIRSSALGRGVRISGAPSGEALFKILCSEGFSDGGRDRHLYAPWSSIVSSTGESFRLRNELAAFVRDGDTSSPTVSSLLTKIKKASSW